MTDYQTDSFDVAVWNAFGDVVKVFWGITADEVDEVREQYADEPLLTVVVTER